MTDEGCKAYTIGKGITAFKAIEDLLAELPVYVHMVVYNSLSEENMANQLFCDIGRFIRKNK